MGSWSCGRLPLRWSRVDSGHWSTTSSLECRCSSFLFESDEEACCGVQIWPFQTFVGPKILVVRTVLPHRCRCWKPPHQHPSAVGSQFRHVVTHTALNAGTVWSYLMVSCLSSVVESWPSLWRWTDLVPGNLIRASRSLSGSPCSRLPPLVQWACIASG